MSFVGRDSLVEKAAEVETAAREVVVEAREDRRSKGVFLDRNDPPGRSEVDPEARSSVKKRGSKRRCVVPSRHGPGAARSGGIVARVKAS
jgi:hypothetical protein